MAWTIPREAWWQTTHDEEVVEQPDPRPRRRSPWESVIDDDLDPEVEDTLHALTANEHVAENEARRVDRVPCWTAELHADGRVVAATEHWLFRERDDLLGFLRWLTANAPRIPERDAVQAEYSRKAPSWEEAFGPPVWTPPDGLQDCGWVRTSVVGCCTGPRVRCSGHLACSPERSQTSCRGFGNTRRPSTLTLRRQRGSRAC